MNKYFLITLLVVTGITATVHADENATYLLGGNKDPRQLDVSFQKGLTVNFGPLSVGGRAAYSDDEAAQKYTARKGAYTGTCDCKGWDARMTQLEKNKDTGFILKLGVRNSEYAQLSSQYTNCKCPARTKAK